jgi:predicted  nucleic acid-binding Zn-ribbon protein
MKKSISLIALTLCFVFAFDASAQMDKAEAKTWKKRIKQLTPEQYKNLLDENKSLKGQVTSLKTELSNVDDRIAEKDEQILTYQSQVGDLRQELSKAKSQAATAQPVANESPANLEEDKGIVFKVQVGAFKKKRS